MVFQYAWLRILETLVRLSRSVTLQELREELARRNFLLEERELADAMVKLQDLELVEALVIAATSGSSPSVTVTPEGERKVRSIVHF